MISSSRIIIFRHFHQRQRIVGQFQSSNVLSTFVSSSSSTTALPAFPISGSTSSSNNFGIRKQQYNNYFSSTRILNDSSENVNDNYNTTEPKTSYYSKEQKDVMDQCYKINNTLLKNFNTKWNGPLINDEYTSNTTDKSTSGTLPIVLLLGNHSSGKSTFCNYLLGRTVQTAGVAPTDDSFTIIAPGPIDVNQDGIALVGNPDFGFTGLRQFGPTLLHHTILKVRTNTRTNFLLIDTPGMIDAPGNYNGINTTTNFTGTNSKKGTMNSMDRGYDFTGVVSWLANRADIVCLFFDPDKPGTTGETLSVLLHSLSGMDHKLLILLNKADQFNKIHDFARAYGSLCWNLSKVIPRKDLPKIYTMCLPVSSRTNTNNNNDNSVLTDSAASITKLTNGLADLHMARDEVVDEVFKAPIRRIDNIITEIQYNTHQLYMFGIIIQELHTKWSNYIWTLRKQLLSVFGTGTLVTTGLVSIINTTATDNPLLVSLSSIYGLEYIAASVFGITIVSTGLLSWYQNILLNEYKNKVLYDDNEIQNLFIKTHKKYVRDGDEYIVSIWNKIKYHTIETIQQEYTTIHDVPIISSNELQQLNTILISTVPNLRRLITPDHYTNL